MLDKTVDAGFGHSREEDFSEAERGGFRLQLKVRAAVLLLVTGFFLFTVTIERVVTYAVFCAVLMLVGWIVDRVVVRLSARRWQLVAAALILLDVATLSVVLARPDLVIGNPWPPQMALRFFTFLYLLLYVMGSALTTSPLLVLWTGVTATVAWSACVAWVLAQPGTITVGSQRMVDTELPVAAQLDFWLDPQFVSVVAFQSQVLVLLLGSAVLALGVRRSRRVLFERLRIAAERRSLARFVPPDLADDLAAGPALGAVRRQPVAVMFADIVGYTAMAERLMPEAALSVLGEFHGRMTTVVLEHGGTVDKFIGDAVMVTFGTSGSPATASYAAQALRCALAANEAVMCWNAERRRSGADAIRTGIGLHCGEALVGTIGARERLEHTVIGDVVNVANRLERLTRARDTAILVSDAVFREAERQGVPPAVLAAFAPSQMLEIRGRTEGVDARCLR